MSPRSTNRRPLSRLLAPTCLALAIGVGLSPLAVAAPSPGLASLSSEFVSSSSTVLTPPAHTGGYDHSHISPDRQHLAGPFHVIRVVDGDTVILDVDGEQTVVRLIGIDTPETKHPDRGQEPFGAEADRNMHKLIANASVWLEYDPTQGRTDAYKRTLGYVWIADRVTGQPTVLANLSQLEDGLATEYQFNKPYRYIHAFREAEARAQRAGLNIWG